MKVFDISRPGRECKTVSTHKKHQDCIPGGYILVGTSTKTASLVGKSAQLCHRGIQKTWTHCSFIIMDALSSWMYCHHGCTVILDVLSSWMYCRHRCTIVMDVLSSWMYCHHGCTVIIDVLSSWIHCCFIGCTKPFARCRVLRLVY